MTGPVSARSPGEPAAGWLMVAAIVLASLTEAVAGTALAFGRTDMLGDTHATPDGFAWLDVGYTAAKLAGLALSPWLLTRAQPRDALLLATLGVGVSCAAAAATADLEALVVFRVVQGLAGGVVLVSGQVILFRAYPRSRQPLLQALFALGAVVAPATIAPALEGWLVDRESWVWIFLTVPPIALAAAALIMLAETAPLTGVGRRPFDWWGAAALGAAFACATFLFSQGNRWDWFDTPWISWLAVAAATSVLLYFVRPPFARERALLDLKVFAVDDFAFAFIVSFVAGAALLGSAFLIPSFAVQVLGFTAAEAGRLLLPSGALFGGALLLAAYLVQVRGTPPIATVPFGILLIMAAMWMLSGSNLQSGANDMHPAILLRGLGLGFLFLAITLIAFGRLSGGTLASGIALFNIGRLLGGLMGVAGLQTAIERHSATGQVVLNAAVSAGSPLVAERLGSTASMLAGRGLDAPAAAKAATAMLGRSIGQQATVIAFDTGFLLLALLFVVAAPLIVLVKLVLARAARRRAAALAGTQP